MRLLAFLFFFGLCVSALGCAGSQSSGKNKDYDRPRAPSTKS
ncbi:MAG: hypothetical protein U0798_08170 [Gemmataceae bacterium]